MTWHQIFDDAKELARAMYGYAIGYLRHLRAFNFDEAAELSEKCYNFIELVVEDPNLSLRKLRSIK